MTLYYADASRPDDTGDGLSIPTAKKTIQAAENLNPAAGSIIHVRQGTYRETATLGVSGSAGNQIEIRGDYTGAIFGDPPGGVVRITGSDNDQTATRANCIVNSAPRAYRTFTNLLMDTTTGSLVATGAGADNNIFQKCEFVVGGGTGVNINGSATVTNNTIQNCIFFGHRNQNSLSLAFVTSQVNNSNNLIQSCIFLGGATQLSVTRIGGTVIKNCIHLWQGAGGAGVGAIASQTALTGGQTITVNNCLLNSCNVALGGQAGNADITEDYNTFYANITDRTNVNTGAHSVTYPPLFDARWFFELVNGGRMLSPFDLASYSQLVNLAGTNPPATDMRGTGTVGAQREWGALEYDPTLRIKSPLMRALYQMGIG